jgi:hypothetical protein
MGAGGANTVTVTVGVAQPLVYAITDVPCDTPVTIVVGDGPAVAVATVVLLLVHVPPAMLLLSVMVAPVHTVSRPDIGPGTSITVMLLVATQPAPEVNVISVVPALTPVTVVPVDGPNTTVAATVVLLVQLPPPGRELDSGMVEPTHTVLAPAIGDGVAFTVISRVLVQLPPSE